MNHTLAMRRLLWKEFRQLRPLVYAIVLTGLATHLLLLFSSAMFGANLLNRDDLKNYILMWLPALFAVGAGAMLIGQEKELRTLRWLNALPVRPRDLIWMKLLVGFSGLVIVWAASSLIAIVSNWVEKGTPGSSLENASTVGTWVMHSVFLLLIGYALAWLMKSSFPALLTMVPVAAIPMVTSWIVSRLVGDPLRPGAFLETSPSILLSVQTGLSGIALWLGWYAGKQYFRAQAPAPSRFASWKRGESSSLQASIRASVGSQSLPLATRDSLVWQFGNQSRGILIGLTGLLGCALVLASIAIFQKSPSTDVPLLGCSIPIAALAVSWLGVSAFHGDRLQNRIRFLADRGIAPNLIWRTRHTVPICILIALAFVSVCPALAWIAACFARGVVVGGNINLSDSLELPSIVAVAFLVSVLFIYPISQWVGQLIASPIVAAILAPVAALAAWFYAGMAIFMCGCPLWLLALCAPLPYLATYWMMGPWMDCRLNWGYWCRHAGILAAWVLVPTIPLLYAVVTTPSMPKSVARELDEFANQSAATARSSFVLTLPHAKVAETSAGSPVEKAIQALHANLELPWGTFRDQIQSQFNDNPDKSLNGIESSITQQLTSTVIVARWHLSKSESEDPKFLQEYRDGVDLLFVIVQRLRWSASLLDQDRADAIECFLLKELLQPPARSWLGDRFEPMARQLADSDSRREARKRAVALSWREFQRLQATRNPAWIYGDYQVSDWQFRAGSFEQLLVGKRRLSSAVADLWRLLKEGPPGASEIRLAAIADYWHAPRQLYGIGSAGK